MHSESIQTPSPFSHFVTLQPDKNRNTLFIQVFRPCAMRLEIELRCILFPLIILDVSTICIQLIGYDLERHTPVYIRFHSWQCKSEQKPWVISQKVMRWKELSVELWDRIVSRHRSGQGYQNIFAALKVPKNTVASIILKCKFGTNKTPWAGRSPIQTKQSGEKVLTGKQWKHSGVSRDAVRWSYKPHRAREAER